MIGEDTLDIGGQVALVTGAGQGVGRGIALELAKHNAGGIAVNDFNAERADAVVEEIRAMGVKAMPAVFDVTDRASVAAVYEKVAAELGAPTILVNNAGNAGPTGTFALDTPFWDEDPAEWNKFVGTNFFGVLNCCHVALPYMVAAAKGRVVTIVSDSGRVGEPRLAVYAAAKAGAAGFMRSLAKDAGRYGVTCNSIALGTIQTMQSPEQFEAYKQTEQYKKAMSHYIVRRYGQPEDVAGLAAFLCSDRASWITGQTYPVNGGYSVSQ
jgi:NAD(P)-dependent dehydrogenase (short-subunit alcohol dehydrogenase family)